MHRHLEAAGTVLILIAALAVTSSVVHREFFTSAGSGGESSVARVLCWTIGPRGPCI